MKKKYSSLAFIVATFGVLTSKAINKTYRAGNTFKYVGTYPVSTQHQVTNPTNWTLTIHIPSYCTGSIQACYIVTQNDYIVVGIRKIPDLTTVPFTQTVTGGSPRFTAAVVTMEVTAVSSKANQ